VKLAFYMMKNNLRSIEVCGFEGCQKSRIFTNSDDGWNLRNGCCGVHSQNNSMLQNHGCINPMHSKTIKEKLNKVILKKYGVSNVSQSDEIKEKKKQSTLKNYGVEHNSQSNEIKEKKKATTLLHYGVEHHQQIKEISQKSANTKLEKYGYSYPLQNPLCRRKAKKTNIERYGYEHVMHNPEIASRAENHSKRWKDYIWKSGEISRVQGYEPIVLKELEDSGYCFEDIKTSKKDMPEIFYEFNNTKHRYYPDIFIPSENLIIEVKSNYTLKKELEKNTAKFQATTNAGFIFKLEVK